MRFDVITLFPGMIRAQSAHGIKGRAVERGLVEVMTWNPRDYTQDRHGSVDDRPYGGGPGMVMTVEPIRSAIRAARAADQRPVSTSLMSPQGRTIDQRSLNALAARPGLILVCGRYEGIDERLIELEIDEEWSLGDYVLSGGELAAMVLIDATTIAVISLQAFMRHQNQRSRNTSPVPAPI